VVNFAQIGKAAARWLPLNLFLCIAAGTGGLRQWRRESAMRGKLTKVQSESVMADVCLGVTVASLSTLVGMGLIIVFM
jgi:hypothetical protein